MCLIDQSSFSRSVCCHHCTCLVAWSLWFDDWHEVHTRRRQHKPSYMITLLTRRCEDRVAGARRVQKLIIIVSLLSHAVQHSLLIFPAQQNDQNRCWTRSRRLSSLARFALRHSLEMCGTVLKAAKNEDKYFWLEITFVFALSSLTMKTFTQNSLREIKKPSPENDVICCAESLKMLERLLRIPQYIDLSCK